MQSSVWKTASSKPYLISKISAGGQLMINPAHFLPLSWVCSRTQEISTSKQVWFIHQTRVSSPGQLTLRASNALCFLPVSPLGNSCLCSAVCVMEREAAEGRVLAGLWTAIQHNPHTLSLATDRSIFHVIIFILLFLDFPQPIFFQTLEMFLTT